MTTVFNEIRDKAIPGPACYCDDLIKNNGAALCRDRTFFTDTLSNVVVCTKGTYWGEKNRGPAMLRPLQPQTIGFARPTPLFAMEQELQLSQQSQAMTANDDRFDDDGSFPNTDDADDDNDDTLMLESDHDDPEVRQQEIAELQRQFERVGAYTALSATFQQISSFVANGETLRIAKDSMDATLSQLQGVAFRQRGSGYTSPSQGTVSLPQLDRRSNDLRLRPSTSPNKKRKR